MRIGCTCDKNLGTTELRGVPYRKGFHCPSCWSFWHKPDINKARGGVGAITVKRILSIPETFTACVYKGRVTGEVQECRTCSGRVPVPMYECTKFGDKCFTGAYSVEGRSCNKCPMKTRIDPTDPKVGVVIGSYLWPSVTEMQIKSIRRTCGAHVPILVVDDPSVDSEKREAICKKNGVDFLTTAAIKVGHVGGDVAALHHGLVWAKEKGLEVLAKLSQRVFLLRPRWLQDGAKELLLSTLPLASQVCVGHPGKTGDFPIRSDAYLVNVSQWDAETVEVKRYNPDNKVWVSGESLLISLIPGGIFWPWSEISSDRAEPGPYEINHWGTGVSEYLALAKELNVQLDPDFHANGWENEHARGEYSAG